MPDRPKQHRAPWSRTERQRKRDYDRTRPSAAARGYGASWRRARDWFLRRHPFCRICEQSGVTRVATVVDHIEPHKGCSARFWDRLNWQPLCKPCHDRKTATEDSSFAGGRRG